MATLEQIEQALRAADAAGNVEDARRLAQAYSQQRAAQTTRADFSGVTSRVDSTEARRTPLAAAPAGIPSYRPTLGVREDRSKKASEQSFLEQIDTGVLSSLDRVGRGIGQLIAIGADYVAPRQVTTRDLILGRDPSRLAEMQQLEVQRRKEDEARLDTPLSRNSGTVANYAMMLLPAGRVTAATLPGRIAQSSTIGAATGAGFGLVDPTTSGESRTVNVLAGGAGGAVGGAAAPVIGRAVSAVAKPLSRLTRRGSEREAARFLREGAQNPQALTTRAPSAVPGVERTLAEETLDPGIAQIQRQFPEQLADQNRANNVARVEFIESQFGGADPRAANVIRERADLRAAQTSRELRNVRNEQPFDPFRNVGGGTPAPQAVALTRTVGGIDSLVRKNTGRPAVQSALQYVRQQATFPLRDARQAWNVRQTINDLMEGRIGGDQAAATAARKELLTVRSLLDRDMTQAFPGWGRFLREYKGEQRIADQVDFGAEMLRRGGVEGLDATGQPVRTLQPGRFRNITDDLDALAASATGFRRSRADQILTPEQQSAVGAVRDDVLRRVEADTLGRTVGSPTKQNFDTEAFLRGEVNRSRVGALIQSTPLFGQLASRLDQAGQARVRNKIALMLASPQMARRILDASSLNDRAVIEAVLNQAAAAGGAQTGRSLAEDQSVGR